MLTAIQIARAKSLAAAHNHQWAAFPQELIRDGLTPGEIGAWVCSNTTPGAAGFGQYCPCIDADHPNGPIIAHETATGRIDWEVFPSGDVEIAVRRPKKDFPVLRATVAADGTASCRADIDGGVVPYRRHYRALAECLTALGVAPETVIVEGVGIYADPTLQELVERLDPPDEMIRQAAEWTAARSAGWLDTLREDEVDEVVARFRGELVDIIRRG